MPRNPIYELLDGAELTFTHTPLGKVTELKGYKELLADVLKDNPLGAQFAAGGSNEAAKLAMSDFFVEFSQDPVKPGDTWESTFDIVLPKLGKATGKKMYTYDGPDQVGGRKTVKISVSFDMTFDLKIDMGAAKVSGTLSIDKSSGTIQFDPETGQLISKKTSYTLSGNISVDVGGNTIEIATEQTQETSVELLDKLPE